MAGLAAAGAVRHLADLGARRRWLAQGPSYGLAYVGIQTMFASAFKRAVGVDVYRRSFWCNHARWRRWILPPYAEWQGFGDHTQRWRSSVMRNADLVELIALETGTDEFDGYVHGLRGRRPSTRSRRTGCCRASTATCSWHG